MVAASTPAPNVSCSLPQPTVALVADDDDDPPGSNCPPEHLTQMRQSEPAFPPIKTRDTFYLNQRQDPSLLGRLDTDTTVADLEKGPATDLADVDSHRPKGWMQRISALFVPSRDIGPRPTYAQSLKAVALYNPLNALLVFIPVSWGLAYSHQSPTLVFVFSALAIIPLAALLGLGTEQIALRTSQSIGGLLNATLGNIIEMIIAGIALKQCELDVVKSSLLGGLVSNLLLVLGCAFMIGGFKFPQQEFQPIVAQLNSSLLIVSVISLIIPAAFHLYLEDKLKPDTEVDILLQLSRGSAIILILIYAAYLVFQFYSHNHLFRDTVPQTPAPKSSKNTSSDDGAKLSGLSRQSTNTSTLRNPASLSSLSLGAIPSAVTGTTIQINEHQETLKLNVPSALALLVAVTILAFITAEHLVDSLEGLVKDHPNISKEWITLIIIPIISNAAEHATAVLVARKGKFDLAMSVAVGSCIQIALFVIPLLVLVAWGMGKPLMLLFDPLETITLFLAVLVVKFSIEDGRSHWMSGLALISVYVMIALAFWFFPDGVQLIQGRPLVCTV